MTPSLPSNLKFSEWLIMYMWSASDRGPAVRSTLQGKDASVTLKGVSQTCAKVVNCEGHLLRRATDHWKFRKDITHLSIVSSAVHEYDNPLSTVNHLA